MRGIGVALPSTCFLNEATILYAMSQARQAGVSYLQVHLTSLLSASTMQIFLNLLQHQDIQLVVHLEDEDDLFSVPSALKECSAWRYAVMHLPTTVDAPDTLQWCRDRLASRQVQLLVENSDIPTEVDRFEQAIRAIADLGVCFDVGHDAIANTGIPDCDALAKRVRMVHLHGVNLLTGKSHLEPWTIGAVRDSVLSKVATSRSAIPIILEIRNISLQDLPQIVNRVNQRLNYLGWYPEQS